MKKMLIAMVSAIALMVSIIGCQVYDSQTNEVLASGMNSAAEGKQIVKWQDFKANFKDACEEYLDNSTDSNLDAVADVYLNFDKFYTAALGNVKGFNSSVSKAEQADIYDMDSVKACYKKNFMKPGKTYDMYACIVAAKLAGVDYVDMEVSTDSKTKFNISSLYHEEYKLKWDYNSKK